MHDLVMAKVGGSLITKEDSPRTANRSEIERILREIKEAKDESEFDLIIAHGSGSFGHFAAKKMEYDENDVLRERSRIAASTTKSWAMDLDGILLDTALAIGLDVFPFYPSSFLVANGRSLQIGFTDGIETAIRHGFVPMVMGDVVPDVTRGMSIASTEPVFVFLSERLPVRRIAVFTDVDGVYDANPKENSNARLIERIDPSNYDQILGYAKGSDKERVTGGMNTKLGFVWKMVCSGPVGAPAREGVIANGLIPGIVKMVLLGDSAVRCTRVTGLLRQ